MSSLPFCSLQTELSRSYFPPSHSQAISRGFLSLSQAISHGFPSLHPVVTSVSLPSRQSKLNENPKASEMLSGRKWTLTHEKNDSTTKHGDASQAKMPIKLEIPATCAIQLWACAKHHQMSQRSHNQSGEWTQTQKCASRQLQSTQILVRLNVGSECAIWD